MERHVTGLEDLTLIKTVILPTEIYRFHSVPAKISMVFLIEIERIILKFVGNHIQD